MQSPSFFLIFGPRHCVGEEAGGRVGRGRGWEGGKKGVERVGRGGRACVLEDVRSWDDLVALRLLETGSTQALQIFFFVALGDKSLSGGEWMDLAKYLHPFSTSDPQGYPWTYL